MEFFGDDVLLGGQSAQSLYASVRNLPIIDYHCHLDEYAIMRDDGFADVGQLWLGADHYKWRAMRMNGIDEKYITGDASWKEKFLAYASVMPKLIGGPLYYFTHLELRAVFGITRPLNENTAEEIYAQANEKIKDLSVRKLLKSFDVEYIATTDDPVSDLSAHGVYDGVTVAPTFRPDKALYPTAEYLAMLGSAWGREITSVSDLRQALVDRLDFFTSKGCKIADHGFFEFPKRYASDEEAEEIFRKGESASADEKDALFGHLLLFIAKEYARRGVLLQLHFSVTRNVNPTVFASQGVDRGCDVFSNSVSADGVIKFLSSMTDDERPKIVMYSLNPSAVPMLACISGAFRNVLMGAAWWFNDTKEGIKANLSQIAEYACLGNNLGMLTDSRSFSSYVRFDFFRRLLCDYVGGLVDKGEYDMESARLLVKDICYDNIKKTLG
ncbi:MAG: glucuronate isomerase [Clostridia bacterium]|nr:glucuronate isomerase [Clostridia bacterium]